MELGSPDVLTLNYRQQDIPQRAEAWHISSPDLIGREAFEHAYLEAVLRAGAAETGIFGLRLMWPTVAELSARLALIQPALPDDAARFGLAFGKLLYVHLSREDKVLQAVSLLKAEQNGLWHLGADGTERERTAPLAPLEYDVDRLSSLVGELEADDAAWNRWFSRHGIEPLRITYERLAGAPQVMLAQVLSELGLDAGIAFSAEVRTAKLQDKTSAEWADRFRGARLGLSPNL